MTVTTPPHHRNLREVLLGRWEPARPLTDSSWLHRAADRRRCGRETGHCWHAEGFTEWWCCMCGGDTDGMPAQNCRWRR